MRKYALLYVGTAMSGALAAASIIGPWVLGDAGMRFDLAKELLPPSPGALLGRAENGVDILTWLVHGARISLFVGVVVTAVSLFLGTLYGVVAGFLGGAIGRAMMRFVDVVLAFPGLLLTLYLASVLRPGVSTLLIALCATGWVGFARVARAQTLSVRERDFVQAAVALGASPLRVLFQHVLPQIWTPLLVQASFGISGVILSEAALSFLGMGVTVGTPSWGTLLEQGVAYLFIAPHVAIFAGATIAFGVMAFQFLGDGLRDWVAKR